MRVIADSQIKLQVGNIGTKPFRGTHLPVQGYGQIILLHSQTARICNPEFHPGNVPFVQGYIPRRKNRPIIRTMPDMEVQFRTVKTEHPAAHPATRRVCRKDIRERQSVCRHKADFKGKVIALERVAQGNAQARGSIKDQAVIFQL